MQTYIIKTIVLTAVILVVIYIFIFRRIRKNRHKSFDSVKDYHDTYLSRQSILEHRSNISSANVSTRMSGDSGSRNRTNYITRYNSNEDYREKLD